LRKLKRKPLTLEIENKDLWPRPEEFTLDPEALDDFVDEELAKVDPSWTTKERIRHREGIEG
jgi:hypothetical protein